MFKLIFSAPVSANAIPVISAAALGAAYIHTLALRHLMYTNALEQFIHLHIYPQNVNVGYSNCSLNAAAAVKHYHELLQLHFHV